MSEQDSESAALVPKEDFAGELAATNRFEFQGIDVFRLGEVMAKSGYFDEVKDAAKAVVKILAGAELGIGPFASMSGIYIEHGKPNLHASLMARLIKSSRKYDYRVRRLDEEGCELEFFERLEQGWKKLGASVFTKRDATAAGLAGKETYKRYPRNLFFARALTNGAHWYCPDVFAGPIDALEDLDLPLPEAAEERRRSSGPGENGGAPAGEAWLVLPQVKMNIIRLWDRALELGIQESELRELLGTYGCSSRKELMPEQAADFVSELSKLINQALKNQKSGVAA